MNWWTEPLQENAPLLIVLSDWVPALLSILLGGILASIVFPRWQDRYLSRKTVLERRQDLRESISSLFAAYIVCWRRLMDIAAHEQRLVLDLQDTAHLAERKESFVSGRQESRDALMSELSRYRVYSSDAEWVVVQEFVRWDEDQATKTLQELPRIDEWRKWQDRIMETLKDQR